MVRLHQLRVLILYLGDSWGQTFPLPLHFWGGSREIRRMESAPGLGQPFAERVREHKDLLQSSCLSWELSRPLAATAVLAL